MSILENTLPKGWQEVNFQEIFTDPKSDVVDGPFGSNLKSSEYTESGIPLARLQNIDRGLFVEKNMRFIPEFKADELERHNFKAGDILITKLGDPLGKACIVPTRILRGVLVADVVRARLEHEFVNTKFLMYQINSFEVIEQFKSLTKGTTRPRVNLTKIRDLKIRICPENEQTRIVEKLEELLSDLDNGVAELKAAQTKLTQYRQSLLKSAVEGSLTAEWRSQNTPSETGAQLLERILKERRHRWEQQKLAEFKEKGKKPPKDWQKKYPEPVKPDTSDLPELPAGWVWASVDQCTKETKDITDGPFGSNLKTAHYTDAGPRVIRLQNIGDGEFFDDKAHISSSHYEKLLKHAFETGDTVIAMMGEILPRACSIPNGVAPGIVKADCARVRVNAEVLKPNLLPYFLNSQPIRNETKLLVKGIGRPRINLSHIRSMAIPICSYQEQMQILTAIRSGQDSIDRQFDDLSKALVSLNAQRKNILKDAFSGKLVEQNPSDEPASVLIEKIKAERALKEKQPKPKTSKKKAPPKVKQMPKLEDILKTQTKWIEAQQLFRECGISDNAETAQVEAIYGELRDLDRANRLDIKREGNVDFIKLKAESVA